LEKRERKPSQLKKEDCDVEDGMVVPPNKEGVNFEKRHHGENTMEEMEMKIENPPV
jgi:hypothetical protein